MGSLFSHDLAATRPLSPSLHCNAHPGKWGRSIGVHCRPRVLEQQAQKTPTPTTSSPSSVFFLSTTYSLSCSPGGHCFPSLLPETVYNSCNPPAHPFRYTTYHPDLLRHIHFPPLANRVYCSQFLSISQICTRSSFPHPLILIYLTPDLPLALSFRPVTLPAVLPFADRPTFPPHCTPIILHS